MITPIGRVQHNDGEVVIGDGQPGPVSLRLRALLTDIQRGIGPRHALLDAHARPRLTAPRRHAGGAGRPGRRWSASSWRRRARRRSSRRSGGAVCAATARDHDRRRPAATASGPCHGRPGTTATPAAASASPPQPAPPTTAASRRPSRPARPAGPPATPRRQHQANPARPVAAGQRRRPRPRPAAVGAASAASAAACTPSTTTSVTTANAPDPAVAHHGQRPLRRAVAAQPVGGVGQPVDVHAAGGERQEPDGEQPGDRRGTPSAASPTSSAARGRAQQRARRPAPSGARRRGAPDVGAPATRTGSTVSQLSARAARQLTPPRARSRRSAVGCVAVSASSRAAICSSGTAATAPVPSPSRMPQVEQRRQLEVLGGERHAPARASAGPAATSPRAPGASSSATSAAAPATSPSSSTGVRRTAACSAEPGERGEVGAAGDPQQGERVAGVRPGPAQGVADRGGLAHPAGVVDPAARARSTATGSAPVSAATSTEAGVVAPTPSAAGHQQVGAGVDLLVGQRPADGERALGLVLGERVLPVDPAAAGADPVARSAARRWPASVVERRRRRPAPTPRPRGRARRPARCARGPPATWRAVIADGCAETPAAAMPWSAATTHHPRPGRRPRRADALRRGEPARPARRAGRARRRAPPARRAGRPRRGGRRRPGRGRQGDPRAFLRHRSHGAAPASAR